ncbi:MAG: flavodoxin-dependent (E)-4-hydroxy-3-methylbut-2-enyl-diphosphate synthase, partial [Alistipes sp.]|nr:flavodoxin-dependent (E)-4-hydroxy-3-methylbut-2-enyl-diphosphate synthase [Alistipes sp.]
VAVMAAEGISFPLHLGVTEAGDAEDGRIKSAVGIGALLADGIGDTVRVSLAEAPENEIPVANMLVEHFQNRSGEFEVLHPELYSPTEYRRRTSAPIISHSEITDNYMVTEATSENPTAEWRAAILNNESEQPVVIRRHYEGTKEEVALRAAADMGQLLLDGLADGVWIDAPQISEEELNEIELIILQASRARFSQTEYIACPSCGRTLYDIEKALAEIKAHTSHLKGLKIGVMGCIVNGPGEMADADYGYVGAGAGRISLYKGKECIERNIPQEEALEHLIELIKVNGDWKESE